MEGTLKTRQLTEYKTLSDGRSGCLFYVGPKELEEWTDYSNRAPRLFLLDSPIRKKDKEPFINDLHEEEKIILKQTEPLLSGYPAWLICVQLTDPKNMKNASYGKYVEFFFNTESSFFYHPTEFKILQEFKEKQAFWWKLIGETNWYEVYYPWLHEISKHISSDYSVPRFLNDKGYFDYAKSLLDLYWEEAAYPDCRICLKDGRCLQIIDGRELLLDLAFDADYYKDENWEEWEEEGLSEKEMNDKSFNLYEHDSYEYQFSGFIVALLNLSRNLGVYIYSQRPFEGEQARELKLEIGELSFYYNIQAAVLYDTYFNEVEKKYKFEEEKKPTTISVDMQDIHIQMLRDERANENRFFRSTLSEMIKGYNLNVIKEYCRGYQNFLITKIGFDPDEKKEEEVKEEERPAELCEYINLEKVAKVGVKTAEDVEKELSQASSCKAPVFVELLQTYQKVGYLDFKGHDKKLIYKNLKKHYGNMDYSYKNFVAYF